MIHQLKTLPPYFNAVLNCKKTFELRKNDRDFKIGDTLILREWNMEERDSTGPEVKIIQKEGYTGRQIKKTISYILKGGKFILHRNYVILSFN